MAVSELLAQPELENPTPGLAHIELLCPEVRLGVSFEGQGLSRLGETIEIDPPSSRSLVESVIHLADGTRTIASLASEIDVKPETLIELCELLEAHQYLWLSAPDAPIATTVFQDEFRIWVRHWVDHVFSDPAWDRVLAGEASPAILVGWSIEQMHYTRTVVEHMTHAAKNAGTSREGQTLLRHLSEEWDHYRLFQKGCGSIGFGSEAVGAALPLSTTKMITTFMRRRAVDDPLVYNACEALLEGTAEQPDNVVSFFHKAQAAYGYPDSFIKPIVKHVRVDETFEHVDIFDDLLTSYDVLPRDRVNNIMQTCSDFADLLMLWHHEIIQYYGQFPEPHVRQSHTRL